MKSGRAAVLLSVQGGPFPDVSAPVIRRRADKMLEHLGLSREGIELSIALVNDEAIRELNRSFRRKNKPTDVLAFPMSDSPALDFPEPAKRRSPKKAAYDALGASTQKLRSGLLGDVILSVETARRQAEANSRPLLAELTMLLAHGLLHLLGYDHQTDAEEREMKALTSELEAISARRASPATKARAQARK